MSEQTNQKASELRQRYWEEAGKPTDEDSDKPAYIPWIEALVAQLEDKNAALKQMADIENTYGHLYIVAMRYIKDEWGEDKYWELFDAVCKHFDALLADTPEMEDRIEAIRERMSKGYVFDQPGEVVVSRDEDMKWIFGRVEEINELILSAFGLPLMMWMDMQKD